MTYTKKKLNFSSVDSENIAIAFFLSAKWAPVRFITKSFIAKLFTLGNGFLQFFSVIRKVR